MKLTQEKRYLIGNLFIYIILSLGLILMIFPYIWMVLASFKVPEELFTRFLPSHFTLQNYIDLIEGSASIAPTPLGRGFLNSFIVASIPAISVMTIGACTGYALAKLPFRGKRLLSLWVLLQMTIPFQLFIIPLFLLIIELKAMNTYQGMILPFLTGPISIFLFAQFFRSIPEDLLDAARVDGLSELGIVFRIMLPNATGVAAIAFLFTFVGYWNEFLWYLIVNRDWSKMPLSVILGAAGTEIHYGVDFARVMALSTVITVPIIIMFFFARRFFVEGISLSGLKL